MQIINDQQFQQKITISTGLLHWLSNELKQLQQKSQLPLTNSNKIIKNVTEQTEQLIRRLFDGNNKMLVKLLLKINYEYFSKSQIMDLNVQENKVNIELTNREIVREWKYSEILMIFEKYITYSERKKLRRRYDEYMIGQNMIENKRCEQTCLQFGQLEMNQRAQLKRYLISVQSSRLKPSLQIQLSCIIIKLLLYLCIKSENNKQFISRIIILSKQQQHQLKQTVEQVEHQLLQEITQNQQLSIKFNSLQQTHLILDKLHQQHHSHHQQLNSQIQKTKKGKLLLQHKLKFNQNQQLSIFQQLSHTNPNTKYSTIFRKQHERNQLLHLLLQQKQKKHQQLITKNKQILHQLNSFQQVLDQLVKQKKLVKKELNQKQNQSFMLQMRMSLKASDELNNIKGQNSKSDHYTKRRRSILGNINLNYQSLLSSQQQKRRSSLHSSINLSNNQINQSINMISQIEQLRDQKQAMLKQLQQLKMQQQKLKRKQKKDQKIFSQLNKLYTSGLKQFGVINKRHDKMINKHEKVFERGNQQNHSMMLTKQRSKTLLAKVNSKRYQ